MSKPKTVVISDFTNAAELSDFRVVDGRLVRREGSRCAASTGEPVRGVLSDHTVTYFVAGICFYSLVGDTMRLLGVMENAVFSSEGEKAELYLIGDVVHIMGGGAFYCYNKHSGIYKEYVGYAPIILDNVVNAVMTNGSPYETYNIISNRVRTRIYPNGSLTQYRLWGEINFVISVIADGVTVPTNHFITYSSAEYSYISFSQKKYASASVITVEYESPTVLYEGGTDRSVHLHGLRSYIHHGDEYVRMFLYGGELGAEIRYSEVSSDNSSSQTSTLDYFPEHARFTVGDGTKAVTHICRYGGRTLIATQSCIYEPVVTQSGVTELGLPMKMLGTKLLFDDLGIKADTETVIYDDKLFLVNDRGMFCVYYDRTTDTFTYSRMEFAPHAMPSYEQQLEMKLYLDTQKAELWCYCSDAAFVYDLVKKQWSKFTMPRVGVMFTHCGKAAFYAGDSIYVFDDTASDDAGVGFEARFVGKPIELGDVFRKKDVYAFGAAISSGARSTLDFILLGDTGNSQRLTIKPDAGGTPSPFVTRVHARLGNVHHVTCTALLPAGSTARELYAIMLAYNEKGEES